RRRGAGTHSLMRTALIHANVVTATGETIDDGTVVYSDDRIESVGRSAAQAADRVIDLEGRTLLPGLIDTHIHMVGGHKTRGFDGEPPIMRTNIEATTKALLEGVAAARTTLHAGFTTIREVGGRDYLDVALKSAQRSGLVEGPRMLVAGPGVWPTGGSGSRPEAHVGRDREGGAPRQVRA